MNYTWASKKAIDLALENPGREIILFRMLGEDRVTSEFYASVAENVPPIAAKLVSLRGIS